MGESTEKTEAVSGEDQRSGLTRRRAIITVAGVVAAATAAGVATQIPRWVEDEPAEQDLAADRLFDANINERGLSGYAKLIPEDNREGLGYHLVPDPVGGGRQVARFTSLPELTLGNEFPRSMVETEPIIKAAAHGNDNDVYFNGFSFYVLDDDFTEQTWITLYTGGYGPPSNGPSFLGIMLVKHPDGGLMFRMGDEPRLLGTDARIPTGQWVGVIQAYKYAYASNGGWVEMWLNTGDAWQQLRINGETRPNLDIMRPNVTDGWYKDPSVPASFSRIGVYGNKSYEAFFATHRIARTFDAADPLR
ncbi:hypothetical protein IEE91_09960 [Kocuria sp. cx-455]|uniref:hypothetical protein n=1 Tax=Kocuria sp. cx-455 TaxID=2771377 RepID=UPI00168522BE|nr:hypothetical protein [Kocuria sp. cx-455]MBD2765507.1 hypothetical protein [Kocuria sp. cx-455]